MNNNTTDQNILYLNYRTSGLACKVAELSVLPIALSNITKDRVIVVQNPTSSIFEPMVKTKTIEHNN